MDCSEEAIARSVEQYTSGRVEEHRGAYAPSTGDFARNVRMWGQALAVLAGAQIRDRLVVYPMGALPPPPAVPLGPIKVDFGQGTIDLTGLSYAEKEAIIENKGRVSVPAATSSPQLRRLGDK